MDENELMPLGRKEIQDLIDELYDYGVDVDEHGNPDILMRTVTELTRIRHIISRPQPSADVEYSDYIKRTPIHVTMAEMIINELKGGLGNQVYIDALEDHIKALQSTKSSENVRCDDVTNVDVEELAELVFRNVSHGKLNREVINEFKDNFHLIQGYLNIHKRVQELLHDESNIMYVECKKKQECIDSMLVKLKVATEALKSMRPDKIYDNPWPIAQKALQQIEGGLGE